VPSGPQEDEEACSVIQRSVTCRFGLHAAASYKTKGVLMSLGSKTTVGRLRRVLEDFVLPHHSVKAVSRMVVDELQEYPNDDDQIEPEIKTLYITLKLLALVSITVEEGQRPVTLTLDRETPITTAFQEAGIPLDDKKFLHCRALQLTIRNTAQSLAKTIPVDSDCWWENSPLELSFITPFPLTVELEMPWTDGSPDDMLTVDNTTKRASIPLRVLQTDDIASVIDQVKPYLGYPLIALAPIPDAPKVQKNTGVTRGIEQLNRFGLPTDGTAKLLAFRVPESYNIYVTINGQKRKVMVKWSTTTDLLEQALSRTQSGTLQLMFNGKQMEEEGTMLSHCILPGSEVEAR